MENIDLKSWKISQLNKDSIIEQLKKLSNRKALPQMARFGINPERALCVKIPDLRKLAKAFGKNHPLVLALWKNKHSRSGFTLMACIGVHDKKATDQKFLAFFH